MHSLRVLLRREIVAAWRHRWAAVIVAWLACLGGWTAVFTISNQFEAGARLYVDADAVLTPLLRGIAIDSGLAAQLDMLQRTLLSRPNLEKVISKTDLDLNVNGAADLEGLVRRLGNDIKIVPQTHSLFTISYRNSSPRLAYDVVQTILTLFVESKTGINRAEMDNARKFLEEQIANYERQLREAEKRRADFRTKYVDILPNDSNGTSGLEAARAAVRQLQGELQDTTLSRDMLNKEIQTTPPLIVTETDGADGSSVSGQRLRDAERNLAELRQRFTDQHPDVLQAKRLVDDLRSGKLGPDSSSMMAGRAAPRSRSAANPMYEQFKVKLVETDATIASLQRRLAEGVRERDRVEEIARGAPGLQAELTNLNRDYEVLRKNYEELLGRREEMRIATAAETDAAKIKLQIIDPPVLPQIPVAPKRLLLLSGVLAGGIGAGIGVALLLVQFDRSFHSIDDLRDLGLPVVGGISLLSAPTGRGRLAAGFTFAVAMALLMVVYAGLLSHVMRPSDFV